MADLGLMNFFLNLEVKQNSNGIFVSHEQYVKNILKKFTRVDCNPMKTPMNVGEKFSLNDAQEKVDAQL